MASALLLLAGLTAIIVGTALWYWPLAFIVGGLALCFLWLAYTPSESDR